MTEIEQAIAAALEHFNLVIQAFDKTRRLQGNKVIGDFVPEAMERLAEGVKTGKSSGLDVGFPLAQTAFGAVFARGSLKDRG